MSGAAWAGLAGAFGFVGDQISKDAAEQRAEKLKEMEDAAQEKRETFLAQFRSQLQDQNAANRNARGMDRDAAKHDLTSGDVTGAYKDPETGNIFGRTKSGDTVPLNITSDDYQDYLKRINAGKAVAGDMVGDKTQAGIDRTDAQTANYGSLTARRDSSPISDPEGDKIRADYQKQVNSQRVQSLKAAAAAQKAGTTPPDPFDENQAAPAITSQLYSVYGGDAVKNALGGGNNAPRSQRLATPAPSSAPQQAAPQTSPTQPNAPSMQSIMAQATAAVKNGADPKAVEARMQQLMQQYGYQPQASQ